MMQKKMWAAEGWENCRWFHVGEDEMDQALHAEVPVLVTDAEGMPDFKPGDRVRLRGATTGEVVSVPFWLIDDGWNVVVSWPDEHTIVECDRLTKLPKEKTVTLRVTGPEDAVENVGKWLSTTYQQDTRGVRVERVEEES